VSTRAPLTLWRCQAQLRHLDLLGNSIGNDAAAAFSDTLASSKATLVTLGLGSSISDEGMARLSSGIAANDLVGRPRSCYLGGLPNSTAPCLFPSWKSWM